MPESLLLCRFRRADDAQERTPVLWIMKINPKSRHSPDVQSYRDKGLRDASRLGLYKVAGCFLVWEATSALKAAASEPQTPRRCSLSCFFAPSLEAEALAWCALCCWNKVRAISRKRASRKNFEGAVLESMCNCLNVEAT